MLGSGPITVRDIPVGPIADKNIPEPVNTDDNLDNRTITAKKIHIFTSHF